MVTQTCQGTKVDGEPCRAAPVQGTDFCKVHGGKTHAKRSLADRRRELNDMARDLAQREKALVKRDRPVGQYRGYAVTALGDDGDADDPLHVARALTWRALAVAHQLSKAEDQSDRHLRWLAEARKHNDSWARIRTDERYVRITAAQAFGMMRYVDEALVEVLGDDQVTADRIRSGIARGMERAQRQLFEVDA